MAQQYKDLFFSGDLYGDYSYTNYHLTGSRGNDRLFGNGGDDTLYGDDGNDRLWGAEGDDDLDGGQGSDILFIDRGNNSYSGGSNYYPNVDGPSTDTLAFYDVVTYASNVLGMLAWSHEFKEFTVGFNVDLESGVTLSQALSVSGGGGYTDNWGTNQFDKFERIEMTNENDVVRDNDDSTEIMGRGGNDTLEGRGGADFLRGGSGTDTASYESASSGIYANLLQNRGLLNDAEGDTYESIENLVGSGFDDILYGTNGANRIQGRGGRDDIIGHQGADTLIGGSGDDHFIYRRTSDSTAAAGGRDSILDFQKGQDLIDLLGIDARSGTSANDSFSFIGSSNFSGFAGQLRSSLARDESGAQFNLVQGDVTGDGAADFSIAVYSAGQALSSNDFFL